MKKIRRKINYLNFWPDYVKENSVQIENLKYKYIKGSTFFNSIFDIQGNQKLFSLEFTIVDQNKNCISYFKNLYLKNGFNFSIDEKSPFKDLLRIHRNLKKETTEVEINLMNAYIDDDETYFIKNSPGDSVLLLNQQFHKDKKIISYTQEFFELDTFVFYDGAF